ncbi:DUF4013 domain-containing protein [Haloterrigena salifodinae]|uniref:DUF4013 domain-containing protein n=1 Tax=Haloterrigena salifodinae TaxID=2675099 RepID=UPI0013DF545F
MDRIPFCSGCSRSSRAVDSTTLQNILVLTGTVPPSDLLGDPIEIILPLNVVFLTVLLGTFYLIPAALANYAVHRTLRSGFSLREISTVTRQYRYLKSWSLALGLWTIGGLLFVAWNVWRAEIPEFDWTTQTRGFILVVYVPTQTGAISTTALFAAGIVSFYLLVYSYRTIGTTLHELRSNDDTVYQQKAVDGTEVKDD